MAVTSLYTDLLNQQLAQPALAPAVVSDVTAGAANITAAAVVSGVVERTGPVAAYSDTLPTAAAIVAALPANTPVGTAWEVTIRNKVAFAETLVTNTGLTLTGAVIIPPNSAGRYLVTYVSATAVTFQHLLTTPLTSTPLLTATALTTNGAGTVTAAGVAGGATVRTVPTVAFTDTFDTTANIIAALPNANIGQSFFYTYENKTGVPATLAAGDASTTLSGITVVPAGSYAEFLVTFSAAATLTIVGVASGPIANLPPAQFVTRALSSSTANAGDLSGAQWCHLHNTGATPGTFTTRTAAQMVADLPNAFVGMAYNVRIVNAQGTGTLTVAGGSSVGLTGTATIAINTFRDFMVTVNAVSGNGSITFQNLGTGTFS